MVRNSTSENSRAEGSVSRPRMGQWPQIISKVIRVIHKCQNLANVPKLLSDISQTNFCMHSLFHHPNYSLMRHSIRLKCWTIYRP
jgi:hypothetical protein